MESRRRPAFTLIELLVVLLIIALVSAATLPAVLPALNHRQISEAARLVQATIEGQRDAAIRFNAPRGVRLLPDPAFPGSLTDPTVPLAYSRLVPLEPAPDYSEGLVSVWTDAHPATPYPGAGGAAYPPEVLRIEAAPYDGRGLPVSPSSWYWNIRVGDRIRIGTAGHLYTVVGPLVLFGGDNPELFVNIGPPGSQSPVVRTFATVSGSKDERVEFLYLVNGVDDDGDGYTDEGWDGVDNDGDNATDEIAAPGEWEPEKWLGSEAQGVLMQPYTIKRRPVPTQGARVVSLPNDVVIDATTWQTTRERSRLPVDPNTLAVDLMISPNGQVIPTTVYSSPASAGIVPFLHLWISERADVQTPAKTGTVRLPMPDGVIAGAAVTLRGERRLITVNSRSGNVTTTEIETFNATDTNVPFYPGQLGIREAR